MIHDKTILVTGGAGFFGSNYVLRQIKKQKFCIINLDALTDSGNLDSLSGLDDNPEHHFVLGSIVDRSLTEYLMLRYQPCAVVNFAVETQIDKVATDPEVFIQTNVNGTFELLEATRKYWTSLQGELRKEFRFVQVSTDEVFGSWNDLKLFTEETAYRPVSLSAACEASSNHLVQAYHHNFSLPTLIVHCSRGFGPYQFPGNLVPGSVLSVIRGEPTPVRECAGDFNDWLYVDDHCRAIDSVLEKGKAGECYNVNGGGGKSDGEILEILAALLSEIDFEMPPVLQQRTDYSHLSGNSSKIYLETGWQPRETLESGLRKTIHWYRNNKEWCQRVLDGTYLVGN